MKRKLSQSLLEETVELLVRHFGREAVESAIKKERAENNDKCEDPQAPKRTSQKPNPSVGSMLDDLASRDFEKHRLLAAFYAQLKERKVLVDSQDIRFFAQTIGMKRISGKSREDLVGHLMRFLLHQPADRLPADLKKAVDFSEAQRQQGFSILTDKLLKNS